MRSIQVESAFTEKKVYSNLDTLLNVVDFQEVVNNDSLKTAKSLLTELVIRYHTIAVTLQI